MVASLSLFLTGTTLCARLLLPVRPTSSSTPHLGGFQQPVFPPPRHTPALPPSVPSTSESLRSSSSRDVTAQASTSSRSGPGQRPQYHGTSKPRSKVSGCSCASEALLLCQQQGSRGYHVCETSARAFRQGLSRKREG